MSTNFEMAIESCATLNSVDDDNFESRSISELVSFLRTAFRAKDFDKVEEALVAKEVKMRKEIESKNKEYELLQSKYEFLRLDNLTHKSMVEQDKVEVDPKGFGKWKERFEELKEMESEIQQLKELIIKVNEDREKKKSALDGFEKMLEAVKEAQEDDRLTIQKLKHKNSELQSAIEAAKRENDEHEKSIEELRTKNLKLVYAIKKTEEDSRRDMEEHYYERRRKYEELSCRVSQLENVRTVIEKGEPIASNRNEFNLENRTGTGGSFVEIISDDDHATRENLFRAHRNQKRRRDSLLNDCEDYDAEKEDDQMTILPNVSKGMESLKKVGAMFSAPPRGRPNKHASKMQFSPKSNDFKNITTSSRAATVMLTQCAEVGEGCRSLDSKFKYGSSHLKSKDRRCNKKWNLEAEMLAAFAENDVLCMEAVCILYRQSSLIGKPYNASTPSRHIGFDEADLLRGSTLALFLTNRDPNGKLKKSVTELEKFDISGLIDCRRIAIQHSKQLFEIYKNNKDQFHFH
ncbi:TSA1-like protein [Cucumis sativus]|uniref:TSA1-like protein n=1 Tax=Cucumis sativus TaxID=3659 RepID=UPI0012F48A3C|nr:TSA1-like protein [Cucumis sativus]